MAGETQTISDYIVHHLTNLTFGKLPGGYHRHDGSTVPDGGMWNGARRRRSRGDGLQRDPRGLHALVHRPRRLFCWLFARIAKKAHAGVPSGW
jgi:F-type H+-transporting ATPase subunit a